MYALLALVAALLTAGSFYFYVNGDGNILYFALAIIFLIITLVFGGLFLSSRVNKTEDIHITE